ncbi:MAG: RDD family protein, partial [Thermoanaerobaculia bacterium]
GEQRAEAQRLEARARDAASASGHEPIEDAGEPIEPEPQEMHDESVEGDGSVAFARRMAAGLADLLILALFGAVELTAGAFILELRFPPAALLSVLAFLLLAALVLLVLAPFLWGTTPGMALADLRIRAADGGSPTLSASSLRFLGFVLTGALAGVPLLVAAFDRRGRTLADLLSGTTIVPAERPKRLDPAR